MASFDFEKLITQARPHILEKICLSLDYETFKSCLEVNKSWRAILTYETFQRKARQNPYYRRKCWRMSKIR